MIKGILLVTASLLSTLLNAKQIALTFDDAPRPDTRLMTGIERTQKLITALKKAQVDDVLMFVTTSYLNGHNSRIEQYTQAGFHIANHSHSHLSAKNTPIKDYLDDILKAHNKLKGYDNVLPYYRYPYLQEGENRQKRDAIRAYLSTLGYSNGYVTVDNFDWYMDSLLQNALAKGKKVNYERLKEVYISVLWESITFYDNIAKQTLNHSAKHILLLHENDLAALFIGDLIKHIKAQGWQVISPQEAYQDPIAKIIPDVLFNGQGRVAAIAKNKGWDEHSLRNKESSTEYLDTLFKDKKVFH